MNNKGYYAPNLGWIMFFALIGIVLGVWKLIEAINWIINHVKIN